ncbi:tetratricopeptide repeat protein [Bacillus solitudinis]|uniref:tetratricopeptide repeat protein n=1 Tax=Bacillus solitudinis TaxID=2014074 RepID=UPI000C2509F7|nr:tetratricopeptide repeat protein [Bacillus solitudinis]
MDKWLQSWDSLFEYTEQTWNMLSDTEQQEQLLQLESAAELLLDAWTDMDEKLALLKTKLAERTFQVSYHSIGTTYYQLEMFEHAAAILAKEHESGEKEELRLLYLAYSYLFMGKNEQARELFLYLIQATKAVMIKHFSYIGLGCFHVQAEKFDEAIDSFEHANLLTTSQDVVYNLGICHYLNKSIHLAKAFFKEAIDLFPDDGEAYFFLGCCQWKLGEEEHAFLTWMECLQLLTAPYALQALAYVCEWHGHHYAAIHCYKRIQALGFSNIETLHGLAWNLALLDQRSEALAIFNKLIKMEPKNENVKKSISWLESVWNESFALIEDER